MSAVPAPGSAPGPRPVLTLLYAPADRSDRAAKALASDADVAVLDLEDAVAPAHKDAARESLVPLLGAIDPAVRRVQVRVNGRGTPWHDADVLAVAALPPTSVPGSRRSRTPTPCARSPRRCPAARCT